MHDSPSSKISCVNPYGSGRARNQARPISNLSILININIDRPAERLNHDAERGLDVRARDRGEVKFSRP